MKFLERIDQNLEKAEEVLTESVTGYDISGIDKGLKYNQGMEEVDGYLEDEENLKESSSCLVDYEDPDSAADLFKYLSKIHGLDDLTVGKVGINGSKIQESSLEKIEIEAELKVEPREYKDWETGKLFTNLNFYWKLNTEYDRDKIPVKNALYGMNKVLEDTGLEVRNAPESPEAEGTFGNFLP
jgi:hypothetical protein